MTLTDWSTGTCLCVVVDKLGGKHRQKIYNNLNIFPELSENLIVNWSIEITEKLGSRLFAMWNRTAGDCLLDSVLQATWGILDIDNTLRRALSDSLLEGGHRWIWFELMHDKTNKMTCGQWRLRSTWASAQSDQESSLCTIWVAKDLVLLHADIEDSDQTEQLPRLIWVFAVRTGHIVGHAVTH